MADEENNLLPEGVVKQKSIEIQEGQPVGDVEVSQEGLAQLTRKVEEGIQIKIDEFGGEIDNGEGLLAQVEDKDGCKKEIDKSGFWKKAKKLARDAKVRVLAIVRGEEDDAIQPEKSEEELAVERKKSQDYLNKIIKIGAGGWIKKTLVEAEKKEIHLEIDPDLLQEGLVHLYVYDLRYRSEKVKEDSKKLLKIAKENGIELDHETAIRHSLDIALEKGFILNVQSIIDEAKKRNIDVEINQDLFQRGFENNVFELFNSNTGLSIDTFKKFAEEHDLELNIPRGLKNTHKELLEMGRTDQADRLYNFMQEKGIELPLR